MVAKPAGPAGGCEDSAVLPGLLLHLGTLPFWESFRQRAGTQAVMRGINAAVVGLLGAALYSPIWRSAVQGPQDFAVALVGFILLVGWKAPPVVVVAVSPSGERSWAEPSVALVCAGRVRVEAVIPSNPREAPSWMPSWLRRTLIAFGTVCLLGGVAAGVGAVWIATILPRPLPSLDVLESFTVSLLQLTPASGVLADEGQVVAPTETTPRKLALLP